MKFPSLREFRPTREASLGEVVKYLNVDLVQTLRLLTLGLTKLSFADNFAGWTEEVLIPAGQEIAVTNKLGEVPSCRIICRGGDGSQNIVDGVTAWTENQVFLRNVGVTDVTVTVAFLK